MANPFELYDRAVLAVFQKASDAIEYLTGTNCFAVARLLTILFSIPYYIICFERIHREPNRVLMILLVIAFQLAVSVLMGWYAGRIEKRQRPSQRNPLELDWGFRVQLTIICLFTVLDSRHAHFWLTLIGSALFTAYGYFISCTPLPPGTRKAWNFTFGQLRPVRA